MTQEKEFVPTEDQILAEMKRAEKRKQYMSSAKAIANRKKYMKKRYAETKATREAIKALKESDPAKYDQLMKAAAAAASKK